MTTTAESLIQKSKYVFFFQAEAGIGDVAVTGVQTCALPICIQAGAAPRGGGGLVLGLGLRELPRLLGCLLGLRQRKLLHVVAGAGQQLFEFRRHGPPRSEERRGGEEGRSRGGADHLKKKKKTRGGGGANDTPEKVCMFCMLLLFCQLVFSEGYITRFSIWRSQLRRDYIGVLGIIITVST